MPPSTIVLLVVVGALLGVAIGEVRGSGEPVGSRLGERVELVELIHSEQQRVDALAQQVDELAAEVAEAEREAVTDAGAASRIQADVEELAVPAGLTPVAGPGLAVVLDDAVGSIPDDADVNDVIIHEEDLQAVINALWAGGAEALAVNGQRVRATTAIRCVGNVLLLHGNTYSPPYTVEAVGDPVAMRDALVRDPSAQRFANHADRFGLGFDVDVAEELVVPAYEGTTGLQAASVGER